MGFSSPGACWAPPPRVSAPPSLADTPTPTTALPYRTWGSQCPPPTPSGEPMAPRSVRQAGRCKWAGWPGRGCRHRNGGPPRPRVTPPLTPAPGSGGSPAPQGGALPGPVLHRGHGKKARSPIPSARVLLKNSSIGGRAGAGPWLRPLPWLTHAQGARDPPPGSPRPQNSAPLGALLRATEHVLDTQTVDSASGGSPPRAAVARWPGPGPPVPRSDLLQPAECHQVSLPWPPSPQCQRPGQTSPQAPLLHAGPSSSLSPGGRRAGTQAGWAGGGRTRPRGQPAPAKHPRPPGALRHQALPLHTCTHTQAHTHTHRHTPSPKWLIIAVKKTASNTGSQQISCRQGTPSKRSPGSARTRPRTQPQKVPRATSSGSGAGMMHSSGFGQTWEQRWHTARAREGPGPRSSSPRHRQPPRAGRCLHPYFQHAPRRPE